MKKLFEKILETKELKNNPPVLVDVGSSGALDKNWRDFAKYSICITFDADSRETKYLERETDRFKKLYVFPFVLSDKKVKTKKFYLTHSPFCSSSLEPNMDNLLNYDYAELFKVEKTIALKTITLPEVCKKLKIKNIDWFKTDSQGTDLRLFESLGNKYSDRTIAVEFEPGILDAYKGEDKLWQVLKYMDKKSFWMSDIRIAGAKRMDKSVDKYRHLALSSTPISPGWAEVTYLNDFTNKLLGKREYYLGWIFAMTKGQYGFACQIAIKGKKKFGDRLFSEMLEETNKHMEKVYFKSRLLGFLKRIAEFIKSKL